MAFSLTDPVALEVAKYTALSYCAGDPHRAEILYVNGIKFNAFANLGYALKEVKMYWEKTGSRVEDELFWVDQICIDQSQPDERSIQVGMMRDIYAGAQKVLISLATLDTDPRGADGVKWIMQVREDLQEMGCQGMEEADDADCHFLLLDYWEEKFLLPSFSEGFLGFYHLLRSPWWTRAWIWQEFVIAREAHFLFGGTSIIWIDFGAVLAHFQEAHGGTSRPFEACLHQRSRQQELAQKAGKTKESSAVDDQLIRLHLKGINERHLAVLLFQAKYNWRGPGDLKSWLECGRHCQTSDPRDKIYAFLGLAHDRYSITPNYSVSKSMHELLVDLFLEIAYKVLLTENNLTMLSFAGQAWRGDEHLVPSWVPDWTDPYYNFREEVERASQFWSEALHLGDHSPIALDGTILKVEGIRIDTLVANQRVKDLFWEKLGLIYTTKGLIVEGADGQREHYGPARLFQCQSDDTLWWCPGTELLFVLRPENDHWLLLFASRLRLVEEYTLLQSRGDHFEWVENITRMILAHDVDALLATPGFKRECIQIH